jgi:hypothetical protein
MNVYRGAGKSPRSSLDVTSVLAELSRLLRGSHFYAATDPRLHELFQRCYRALRAELDRAGPLAVAVQAGSIELGAAPLGNGLLDELARELESRGLCHVCFDPELDVEAFAAFVQVMTSAPSELEKSGGVESILHELTGGAILTSAAEPKVPAVAAAACDAATDEAARPVAGSGDATILDDAAAPALEVDAADADLGHEDQADLETDSLEVDTLEVDGFEPDLEAVENEAPEEADATGSSGDETSASRADPASTGPAPELEPSARPTIGFAPEEDSAFALLVREFDDCEENALYARLADRILELADRFAEQGRPDEAYRACVTFYAHASDDRKRNAHHRTTAQLVLERMLCGRHLGEVLRRCCDPAPDVSVQATQVLLRAGRSVIPGLLRAIHLEADPDRQEQLTGILLTLAENATDALFEAMEDADPKVARTAVRLSGETQNPQVVERLHGLLGRAALREEAARALARIGDPQALQVLVRSIDGGDADLARIAALALAATGQARVAPALLRALRRASRNDDASLGAELCRALGRLGHPEAAPELAALLKRRGFFQRGRPREVKAAAIAALTRLPGDVAYGALAQAARGRDARLRRMAQDALDRRAKAET